MADPEYSLDELMEKDPDRIWQGRPKARIILEECFLEQAYARMKSQEIPTSALVDLAKLLVDIGDVKPKTSTTPTQGPTASINIVFPQLPNAPSVVVDAGEAVVCDDADDTPDLPALPPPEVNYNTPAMDFVVEDLDAHPSSTEDDTYDD